MRFRDLKSSSQRNDLIDMFAPIAALRAPAIGVDAVKIAGCSVPVSYGPFNRSAVLFAGSVVPRIVHSVAVRRSWTWDAGRRK